MEIVSGIIMIAIADLAWISYSLNVLFLAAVFIGGTGGLVHEIAQSNGKFITPHKGSNTGELYLGGLFGQLKLLFTKRTLPHDQCIKVGWPPEDRDLSWVSLFLVPTEEDKRTGWSVGTELKETFLEFLRACTPPNSYTYALLA